MSISDVTSLTQVWREVTSEEIELLFSLSINLVYQNFKKN